jgi:anti-sigma factor RsiW
MDKDRDIMHTIHKILDNEGDDADKKLIEKSVEDDAGLREEFSGLASAVRMLEQSKRREPPAFFTAEVMKKLARKRPSVWARMRAFLFGSRVLHWNMASAIGMAVVVLVALITVSRVVHRETTMNAAGPVESAVTVRLTFYAPQASTVSVAGDFNKWKTDADEMKGTDGMWSIDLQLRPGVYSYSFVVDGKSWVADPGAQSYADDGFGARNAVLRVAI